MIIINNYKIFNFSSIETDSDILLLTFRDDIFAQKIKNKRKKLSKTLGTHDVALFNSFWDSFFSFSLFFCFFLPSLLIIIGLKCCYKITD